MTQPLADYRLTIDGDDMSPAAGAKGVDFTPKVRPRLISLSVTEKRGGEADQLELVLDDTDGKLKLPRKGAVIALSLGWARGTGVTVGLVDKGRFKVDDVEWSHAPDQVSIRARSADLTADFKVRREQGYRDTTLGAIAREVAGRAGLEAKVDGDLADIPVPVLAQHHTSDMQLLRRLGREHDAVATVKAGKLILSPIGKGASASGAALPAITLRPADVAPGSRYREVDRAADAGVEARWHDSDAGERRTVTAGGGGDAKGKPRRLRRVYHSEADASAAAKAEASRAARAEAEFECALPLGRPDIAPEQAVTLAGFKDAADARKWLIAEATHTLDSSGLKTSVKLETKAA